MSNRAIATPPGEDTIYIDAPDNPVVPFASAAAAMELKMSDADMARVVEDIFNVLTAEQKAALPDAVHTKINRRVALRAQIGG